MSDMINGVKYTTLIEKAKEAQQRAYCAYSNFKVGAAVLTRKGNIYTGCNIENASYGLTMCADRMAMFKAVSEGETDLDAMAIIVDSDEYAKPCGACRQVMAEFMDDDGLLILCDRDGNYVTRTLGQLLPEAFTFRKTMPR